MPLFSTPIDGISTTVAVARSLGSTSLTVASAAGFGTPTSDAPVRITCVPKNTTNRVHFYVTGVSGNVLTISAPADGYSDLALPIGSTVKVLVSAGTILELQTAILDVPAGPQGYQGSQGSTGLQSQTGSQGYQGSQGQTGAGTQGATGSQGPQGRQGFQGFQGATGTGSQGYQGFQGNQGSGGLQGSQGATGTGSQGAQGSAGTQGAQGRQGFQGSTGAGSQGFQGVAGSQGFQGVAGSQRFQGQTGPQGSGSSPGGSSGTIQINSSGSLAGATGVNYASTGTNLKITPQHTGDVALGVQGITGQTANSLEIRNASGGLGTSIDVYGNLTVNGTSGTFDEVTSNTGISFGLADSPRMLFCSGTSSQNWQIDNYGGTFRWFTPGVTRMTLSGSGAGLTVPGSVNVTSTSSSNNMATYTDSTGNLVVSVGPEGQITAGSGLTVHDKVGIGTTSPLVGLHQAGGGYHLEAITPPTPTITQHGTAGSATWYYWIVVKDRAGNYTGLSTVGLTTTSNGTLGTSNYNVITFSRVDGAYEYFLIRASSDGLDPGWYIGTTSMIGSVSEDGSSSYSINDQIAGDPYIFGGPISIANQTANASIDGSLTVGSGDAVTLQVNGTNNPAQSYIDVFQVNGWSGAQAGIDQYAMIRTALTTGMPSGDPINIGAMAWDASANLMYISGYGGWVALLPPETTPSNPPDLSTFTPYGYAIASTGQSFNYRTKSSPNCTYLYYTSLNAGSHQPFAYVQSLSGATVWTAVARVQGNIGPTWAASAGICLLESSTGKMITWGPIFNYGTYACNSWGLTANTSSPGGSFGTGVYSTTQTYEAQWLKLHYDSSASTTSVAAYISVDGTDFTYVTNLGFSGNFTTAPDSIGIGGDVYVGFSNDPANPGGWSILNWSFTT